MCCGVLCRLAAFLQLQRKLRLNENTMHGIILAELQYCVKMLRVAKNGLVTFITQPVIFCYFSTGI